jgi:hypothetical protein
MATKSGNYVLLDDGTWAQQVQIAGTDASSSSTGALGVNVKQADAIVPVDIQNRLASTIQTQSGVSIAPSGSNLLANFIDCDGFDKVAGTLMNDAATNNSLNLKWSNDGTNFHGDELILASAAVQKRPFETGVKARYLKVEALNGDVAAHTMSAWVYLKA